MPKSASSAHFRTGAVNLEPASPAGPCGPELSTSSPEVSGFVEASPDTLAYLEHTKLSGLPVIPFAFPTSVVAEKLQNKKANADANRTGLQVDSDCGVAKKQKTPSGDSNKSEPRDIVNKDGSAVVGREREGGGGAEEVGEDDLYPKISEDLGPKSLENLVHLAQKQLRMETMYDIYSNDETITSSLGLGGKAVGNGIKTAAPKKRGQQQQQQHYRRHRRQLPREPSSEEGYVEMAPNVCSRNHSPTPPVASSSSVCSGQSSSVCSSNHKRRRWSPETGEEEEEGGEEEVATAMLLLSPARCMLSPDRSASNAGHDEKEEGGDQEEEHFEMDFSKA